MSRVRHELFTQDNRGRSPPTMLRFETLDERRLLAADLQTIEAALNANVAIVDDVAFAAAWDQGLLIVDLESMEMTDRISPPPQLQLAGLFGWSALLVLC